MFDILHIAHINCGHGGRNQMEHSIKQKYYQGYNFTIFTVMWNM